MCYCGGGNWSNAILITRLKNNTSLKLVEKLLYGFKKIK